MHPVFLKLGTFEIYSYGVFVALAVSVSIYLASKKAAAFGFRPNQIVDLVLLIFVSGILGARIFYVAQHWHSYQGNFWQIFNLREGGLVWYGGFFAGLLTGAWFSYFRRWPVLKLVDFFAPIAALAHAIGRVGCFLNGCCYGRPTQCWGVVFNGENVSRIPIQLYEALSLTLIASFLFRLQNKNKPQGLIFVYYLIAYSITRFVLEFFRANQESFLNFTLPQWISLLVLGSALVLYLLMTKVYNHDKKV